MECQKIINLLDLTFNNSAYGFNTKIWVEGHDQSGKICNINKQI